MEYQLDMLSSLWAGTKYTSSALVPGKPLSFQSWAQVRQARIKKYSWPACSGRHRESVDL